MGTGNTFGWICTGALHWEMANAMLDEHYEDITVGQEHKITFLHGRIGFLNVLITCLPEGSSAADVTLRAQKMKEAFTYETYSSVRAIMMTGFASGARKAGVRLGDLVISPTVTEDDRDIQQRAVYTLQREVGADGSWLSKNLPQFPQRPSCCLPNYPLLHYGQVGLESPDSEDEELQDQSGTSGGALCYDTVAGGLGDDPTIVGPKILGVTSYDGSHERKHWKRYAAATAASYVKEFLRVIALDLMSSVQELRGTEKAVPPPADPELPPFQHHKYPSHGDAVLLVIPTENEFKKKVLQETFRQKTPSGVTLHTISIPVESEVGEQPYNEAGAVGAYNRISNALHRLDATEYQETLRDKGIGTVIVASIENYIQTDNIERPTDYGVVVIHNATSRRTRACVSWGVTVSPNYVSRARYFGDEGDPNRGKVTVGRVLAANAPGLDKANWHKVLSARSRYDLLRDAVRQLSIPW